jgi:hypothetical protein
MPESPALFRTAPERDEVHSAFESAKLEVWRCLDPQGEWAGGRSLMVEAVFEGGTGDVGSVGVEGELSSAESDCVREVVGRLHVPVFTNPQLPVDHSYAFPVPCVDATPDAAEVEAILERICNATGGCVGRDAVGDAMLAMTIQGLTGRVTRINVTGDLTGPTATCLSNLYRAVDFPVFCSPTLTVDYTCTFPRPAPVEPGTAHAGDSGDS